MKHQSRRSLTVSQDMSMQKMMSTIFMMDYNQKVDITIRIDFGNLFKIVNSIMIISFQANGFDTKLSLLIEHGIEINKDGRVKVEVVKNNNSYDIETSGNAVLVKEFDVTI